MTTRPHSILEPGHEAEWEALNAEKQEAMRPSASTPVGELLGRGQRLSAQAARLLSAVERAAGEHRRA